MIDTSKKQQKGEPPEWELAFLVGVAEAYFTSTFWVEVPATRM